MPGRRPATAIAPATTLVRLVADEATARRLYDIVSGVADADGIVVAMREQPGGWDFEAYFRDPPDEAAFRRLIGQAAGAVAAKALHFETIATQDWVAASLAALTPVRCGRFVVHGAHARGQIPRNAIAIEIEAALAFGTGHHGTTRGCLFALDQWLKRRCSRPLVFSPSPLAGEGSEGGPRRLQPAQRKYLPPHPARRFTARHALPTGARGKSILDIGTGSGVLAIAAARALRRRVLASDIDMRALGLARENARRNHCAALIELLPAAGLAAARFRARKPYELIFANILAAPLQMMAAPAARLLAPGGRIVLSGLLPGHANAVIAAYRAQGLSLARRIALDGWVTLVMRRR